MTDQLIIPDFNEFHPMEEYQGPTINRAFYNTTLDKAWAAGDAGKAALQPWWMPYVYISQAADPVLCARALKADLQQRGIHPNAISGDFEEGAGDQQPREAAWLGELAGLKIADLDYSGLWFTRSHNLTGIRWLAAYGQNEPTDAHTLWQFTDAYQFPGVSRPCDASLFHGTLADLIALTGGPDMPTIEEVTQAVLDVVRREGISGAADPAHNGVNAVLAAVAGITVDPAKVASALAPLLDASLQHLDPTDLDAIAKAVNDELARRAQG